MITARKLTEWGTCQHTYPNVPVYNITGAQFEVTAFGETRIITMQRGRTDDEADTSEIGCRVGWSGVKVWKTSCRFYRQADSDIWILGSSRSRLNGKQTVPVCWIDNAPESAISQR